MSYSPNNDPYIPGDPYSYNLTWLIAKIKDLEAEIEELKARVEALEEA